MGAAGANAGADANGNGDPTGGTATTAGTTSDETGGSGHGTADASTPPPNGQAQPDAGTKPPGDAGGAADAHADASMPAGVVALSDAFSTSVSQSVAGLATDGTNLPGGAWSMDSVNVSGTFQAFIDPGDGNPAPSLHLYDVGGSTGSASIPLGSRDSYQKPAKFSIQVDIKELNPGISSSSASTATCPPPERRRFRASLAWDTTPTMGTLTSSRTGSPRPRSHSQAGSTAAASTRSRIPSTRQRGPSRTSA
jgi:hypothetical protein